MKVIKFNKDLKLENNSKRVATFGKFNSFHKGHQKILRETLNISNEKKIQSIVFTFESDKFENVFTFEERKSFFENLGFDYLIIFDLTFENMNIEASEFISILKENFNVTDTVVGKYFKFGKGKKGDTVDLDNNFKNLVVDYKLINNQKISTTLSKLLIEDNDFENLEKILGFKWFFKGKVIHGKGIGKKLNFPTANIKYDPSKKKIKEGVFFSTTILKNKKYFSLTSISTNPTFEDSGNELKYETFLINYQADDFYGEEIVVELHKLLRLPIKFSSKEMLIKQMNDDKKKAIKYFAMK